MSHELEPSEFLILWQHHFEIQVDIYEYFPDFDLVFLSEVDHKVFVVKYVVVRYQSIPECILIHAHYHIILLLINRLVYGYHVRILQSIDELHIRYHRFVYLTIFCYVKNLSNCIVHHL